MGRFVWRKKIERDVSQGVPLDAILSVKAEKKRQRERMAEIEKVKKRREERAVEKSQREEAMALLARERAQAEFQDWEKKEEEFDFHQSKLRSEIRLREGRAKPIDVLSRHLNEPHMVFKGLTVEEMEELRREIRMHRDMDRATPTHIQYWEALMVVCDWELAEASARKIRNDIALDGRHVERGLHSSIESDVKNILEGKSHGELEAMQSEIESMMRAGTAKVVEFWESVLNRLPIFKATACLKEIHSKMLQSDIDLGLKPIKAMGLEEGDIVSGSAAEVSLGPQVSRKPKYLNRVHTGYDWNKYNRVHYDHENPPPKYVQGYKFNIFYPDLVDKKKTPKCFVEEENGETCIIRFTAGPPYDDIAFRIVNKEWETSQKKGYKCTFDFQTGIFHLSFNFKRFRYRR